MEESELRKIVLEKYNTQRLTKADLEELFNLVDEKNRRIHQLERKNEVLHQQNLELSQDIENVRSDFGGEIR